MLPLPSSFRRHALLVGVLFGAAIAAAAPAAPQAGVVASFEGSVTVHPNGSVRGRAVAAKGEPVAVGDLVRTRGGSKAVVQLVDGSRVMLEADSTLRLVGLSELEPQKGRVLFDIKTQGKVSGVVVQTPTAVLGVKGTRFLVEPQDGGARVYLKEGELAISAKQGEFRMGKRGRGRPAPDPRTEAFKKRLDAEFAQALAQFSMQAGEAVDIQGQNVNPIGFTRGADQSFDAFEAWLLDDSDLDDFPELDLDGTPKP